MRSTGGEFSRLKRSQYWQLATLKEERTINWSQFVKTECTEGGGARSNKTMVTYLPLVSLEILPIFPH